MPMWVKVLLVVVPVVLAATGGVYTLIDARIKQIDKRIGELGKALGDQVGTQVDRVGTQFTEVSDRVAKVEGRLEQFQQRLEAHDRQRRQESGDTDARLREVRQDLDLRLRQIEEQIPLLRSRIRAASIGFQDPEIRRVTLAAQQSFRVVRPPDLDLTYTILDVSAGQIRMELRATTSRAAVGPRQLVIPLDPRAPTRIPTPIPGMPVLHIAVIERPAPNEAIFAIGPVAAAERS